MRKGPLTCSRTSARGSACLLISSGVWMLVRCFSGSQLWYSNSSCLRLQTSWHSLNSAWAVTLMVYLRCGYFWSVTCSRKSLSTTPSCHELMSISSRSSQPGDRHKCLGVMSKRAVSACEAQGE
ncbi:uncharacterized protein DMAD_13445 [Drosophila madeirensis]|uniref:Secreted protein n=1 Tax=Drosophila madeirensis TaxID=30013 RepID=A0AAU9FK94_DROMD